jgi:putative oxidoreductase
MTQSDPTAATPTRTQPGKATNIALWVVQILLALAFIGAASGKLLGNPDMVGLYEVIGIGQWFRFVTGLLELTGAILIVIPRTKFFGAALLGMIMVGAVLTHLFILHSAPTAPAVLFLLAGIVAWGRRGALNPALSRLGLVTP